MAILDRFRKKTDATPVQAKKPTAKKASAKKDGDTEIVQAAQTHTPRLLLAYQTLSAPHVSEKAARMAEKNVYVFQVPVSAEKVAIKKSVEAKFNVKVVGVRTIKVAGKPVRRGRRVTARKDWKKAIVTLAAGQKIDMYEGV